MLDIIVAHYDEPWETGRPYFDILACQKGVDFEQIRVILVHDGTECFPDELFSHYPYQVEQHRIEHRGISAVRNYGMSQATAKWITFCDFDDSFSTVYSLKFVMDVLGTDDYDLLWNPFFVENRGKDGQFVLTTNEKFNMVWIHNKYFRLDFMRKYDLKFNEDLYFCEDSAMLAMLNLEIDGKRIGTIKSPVPLYVWSYREGSATTDKALTLKNMIGHFMRNEYVVDKFCDCNHEDKDAMVARTLTDAYVSTTRKEQPDGIEEVMVLVRDFYLKHKAQLKNVDPDTWQRVVRASMKEAKGCGFLNDDRPLFADWLRELEKG